MSYSKCGLCLQDLEVIKPATGIRYIRCLNWKECLFFCPEENINGYQQCIYDRAIPEYKVSEGGKPLMCKHMDTSTLRVSRSVNNPFGPYFTCTVEPRLSGSRLSGLFLWSQFGNEYLLVTIKIRSHTVFTRISAAALILFFRATSAALIRGRRLFKHCARQIYLFHIFIQRYTFYLLIFLWTDTKLIVNQELREKFTR